MDILLTIIICLYLGWLVCSVINRRNIDKNLALVKSYKHQMHELNEVLRYKNKALDAMYYVWCSGGCESGMRRYGSYIPELDREIVEIAEKNTKRMRTWLENKKEKSE